MMRKAGGASPAPAGRRYRFLVADDERDAAELSRIYLRRCFPGCEVAVAYDGARALQQARAEPPDLILLDAKMPAMDGFQVCRQLREDPRTAGISVLLYSGYVETASDGDYGVQCGADGFLTKPLVEAQLVCEVRSILRLREAQEALAVAKAAAEEANYAKSALLAGLSHEFRNPLHTILGFSQVLEEGYDGPLTDRQRQHVRDILASGRQLMRVIDGMLALADLDLSADRVRLAPCPVRDAIDASRDFVRERCVARGIALDVECAGEGEGVRVMADSRRLRQILFILLTNAQHITPDGGRIAIGVKVQGALVALSVSDGGAGLSPEDCERVFDTFFQVPDAARSQAIGVGLGLTLVRRLVGLQGGKVWAERATTGQGTRFVVTLPAAP